MDPEELADWNRGDAKARTVTVLTLNEGHLGQVRVIPSAFKMWLAIKDIFQRNTLMNEMNNRRRFNSAKCLQMRRF